MGSKPRIDARHVESVAALRQHADFVSVNKLRQANRAVGELGDGFGRKRLFRERTEDFLFQALVGGRIAGAGAARVGGGGSSAGKASEPGAACNGYEAEHAD